MSSYQWFLRLPDGTHRAGLAWFNPRTSSWENDPAQYEGARITKAEFDTLTKPQEKNTVKQQELEKKIEELKNQLACEQSHREALETAFRTQLETSRRTDALLASVAGRLIECDVLDDVHLEGKS